MTFSEKIFAVYKPKGPTSHDIIDQIRRITGVRKVGHAGTLDPLAEGVLVVGVGREATKKLSEIVAKEKEYIAVIRLGEESETDDAEKAGRGAPAVATALSGKQSAWRMTRRPTIREVREALAEFVGEIQQVPPKYSAVKIKGKEAYKRARKGESVAMKARSVIVREITLSHYRWPDAEIRVVTGPGVYIRSLARDLGRALGTGAYLFSLLRTRVGAYALRDALTIEELRDKSYELRARSNEL